ncbi:MAG TPA: response regulator [Candidatus Merdisoma merdipullorum]|nr:response regulator [Candidatus Merdisoma merdipullorum]
MYTIVIADDETELRQALIRRIDWESVGFQVVGEAENGIEALELVGKLEPDLLLTDVRMPFMSGIELAREVREIRPTMQIAFLSGFDDFTYAQQAIQYNIISYMLKPISSEELTEELRKIKKKIDERFEEFTEQREEKEQQNLARFLMPLLLDSFQNGADAAREKALEDEAVRLGFLKNAGSAIHYTVLVTSFMDKTGNNCTDETSAGAVHQVVSRYLRHAGFFCNGRVVSLLAATQGALDKYLHIIVEDIVQSVQRILGLSAVIGVSRSASALTHCHEAYVEAVNAASYSRSSGGGVYFISDIERVKTFDQETVQTAVGELENLVRSGTAEELEDCLKNYFRKMELEEASPAIIQLFSVQLSAAVFRVVYAVADTEAARSFQQEMPMQNQQLFEDVYAMEGAYLEFCLAARELVSEYRQKSGSIICDKALALIESRYMDPGLSLLAISTEISVSPNYLSALIKRSTGSTFVDLLTRKRIETAKRMLLGTPMKIREIAEKCGYNDQHYFSYCFKKYEGISPNACRRQHEEQRA